MKFKRNRLSIQVQLLLIFLILGVVTISSFVVIYLLNKSIKQERALVQSIQYLENSLIEFQTISINYEDDEEEQKRLFSHQIDNFESSFDEILSIEFGYQIYGNLSRETTNDTLNNYIKSHDFSREQKILLHCNALWNRLTLFSENIIFKTFTKDTTFSELQLIDFIESEIKKTRVENSIKTKKTLTKEATNSLTNIKILALKLSHQFSDLEQLYLFRLDEHVLLYNRLIIFIFIINILCLYIAYSFSKKIIIIPLIEIYHNTFKLIKGDLSINVKYTNSKNEIGVIGGSINYLRDDLLHVTRFVEDITKGKLESTELDDQEHKTPLFNALKNMQNELRKIRKEEQVRNWTIEGQAIFSQILNKSNQDFNILVDEIIATLVNYLSASQGALFTIDEHNKEGDYLKMVACYAFERKKFMSKSISKGDGLIGQAWQEKSTIFITDLPETHISIKSGLGDATPSCILIVPLIDNQHVFGVIELASFQMFEKHQIHFVETIGQTIAAALYTVQISQRTQALLKDSQLLTEKMRAQEEEMSQNFEELQATQEELKRREVQKENEFNSFTNKFNTRLKEHQELEENLKNQIRELEDDLLLAQSDNSTIRNLRAEIEELKKIHTEIVEDLKETIKIKEIRIQKMRNKASK